jgi:hypothetical protein
MLHRHVLIYLDRLLRDIALRDGRHLEPFGGKCIILGGDWKQLAPVVEHGGRPEQVSASIKKDPLFRLFEPIRLTQNMRADPNEIELCEWLIRVGNGIDESGNRSKFLRIKPELLCNNLDDMIDFCFPRQIFSDPFGNQCKFFTLK